MKTVNHKLWMAGNAIIMINLQNWNDHKKWTQSTKFKNPPLQESNMLWAWERFENLAFWKTVKHCLEAFISKAMGKVWQF